VVEVLVVCASCSVEVVMMLPIVDQSLVLQRHSRSNFLLVAA
jgi:hypothetical protein